MPRRRWVVKARSRALATQWTTTTARQSKIPRCCEPARGSRAQLLRAAWRALFKLLLRRSVPANPFLTGSAWTTSSPRVPLWQSSTAKNSAACDKQRRPGSRVGGSRRISALAELAARRRAGPLETTPSRSSSAVSASSAAASTAPFSLAFATRSISPTSPARTPIAASTPSRGP